MSLVVMDRRTSSGCTWLLRMALRVGGKGVKEVKSVVILVLGCVETRSDSHEIWHILSLDSIILLTQPKVVNAQEILLESKGNWLVDQFLLYEILRVLR